MIEAPPRRHDLDALRAFAMLLGIVFHLALSFGEPAGWFILDSHRHVGFKLFTDASHGFRMQLFFVVSGFFTAMLLARRGLWSLVKHRMLRILLPLLIGMFTVNIINIVAFGWAMRPDAPAERDFGDPAENLWSAAAVGDVEQVKGHLVALGDIDGRDQNGSTPLSIAVNLGRGEIVDALLAAGADPSARNRDRHVPLHGAAFFGRPQILQALLDAGADPRLRNGDGKRPRDVIDIDWGTTQWIAALVGTEVDRGELEKGRERAKEILDALSAPSPEARLVPEDAKDVQVAGVSALAPPSFLAMADFMEWARNKDAHAHLWFLWFLCLFLVPFAILAPLRRWVRLPRALIVTPLCLLWLLPLTFFPQAEMKDLGPDTSAVWAPPLHLLAYYFIFFCFGALYYGADDREGRLGRRWWILLPLALLLLFPLYLEFSTGRDPLGLELREKLSFIGEDAHAAIGDLAGVAYTWLMVLGFFGMFRALIRRRNKVIRYLSDSAYWLYIAHLPLVPISQRLVRDWDAPPLLKLTVITVVVTGLLLLSYQILVRHTPIGWLLNGRRRKTVPPAPAPSLGNSTD